MKRVIVVVIAALFALSCARAPEGPGNLDIAVFVPGVVSGSPIYELLVAGAEAPAAEIPDATVKVIEAGYNQAEWLDRLTAVAASGEFELIVSSNPALPELCAKAAEAYPDARFLVTDAYLEGNPAIHTVLYNQLEQGYIVGLLAGLVTRDLGGPLAAGLVAAQRYPTLDRLIQPGFEAGLKAVDPSFRLEYREIGNWYDANKAAELSSSLFDAGVRVILPIAGGAGQGAIAAARERGGRIVWFDASGYSLAPETVIGCAVLGQDRLVKDRILAILKRGEQPYGQADIVGVRDGLVGFDAEGPGYAVLPAGVRSVFEAGLDELRKGRPDFTLRDF